MLALHGGGSRDGLEIHPHLWAGIGLFRGGAGTAPVGSHEEVAGLIEEYAALGIEEFVLSGYPHLEEAYMVRGGRAAPVGRRGAVGTPRRRAGGVGAGAVRRLNGVSGVPAHADRG
ncbi:hypothetical protein FBY34_6368 [Streptomyces sp. SLBN-115]|nr:hypothetical protein FBY34_6368 [Streptomyces sp. SLBN-115]